jgi:hypothetical protein
MHPTMGGVVMECSNAMRMREYGRSIYCILWNPDEVYIRNGVTVALHRYANLLLVSSVLLRTITS